MSTHAETIQYAQLAITKCEEMQGVLAHNDQYLSEIEQYLRAGFDTTADAETLGQFHQMAANGVLTAQQAVAQLRDAFENALARYQAAGPTS